MHRLPIVSLLVPFHEALEDMVQLKLGCRQQVMHKTVLVRITSAAPHLLRCRLWRV